MSILDRAASRAFLAWSLSMTIAETAFNSKSVDVADVIIIVVAVALMSIKLQAKMSVLRSGSVKNLRSIFLGDTIISWSLHCRKIDQDIYDSVRRPIR